MLLKLLVVREQIYLKFPIHHGPIALYIRSKGIKGRVIWEKRHEIQAQFILLIRYTNIKLLFQKAIGF